VHAVASLLHVLYSPLFHRFRASPRDVCRVALLLRFVFISLSERQARMKRCAGNTQMRTHLDILAIFA